jgi:hypothetical protein
MGTQSSTSVVHWCRAGRFTRTDRPCGSTEAVVHPGGVSSRRRPSRRTGARDGSTPADLQTGCGVAHLSRPIQSGRCCRRGAPNGQSSCLGELVAGESTAAKYSSRSDPERALATLSEPVTSATTFNDPRAASSQREAGRGIGHQFSSGSRCPIHCVWERLGKFCRRLGLWSSSGRILASKAD